ncbi:hypothetical protein [Nonomuraea longispora]|uniref:hypothetical protein n=1 Tax=Nonomuraea longispora TaxID=1848320 RepID=UPI001FE77E44|nr:hypothetical protein [Nonomuraea longispora]
MPSGVLSFWDMTVLTYWAWSAFPGHMWSAQGADGLGYALPAAIGAAATGQRALAISGVRRPVRAGAERRGPARETTHVRPDLKRPERRADP